MLAGYAVKTVSIVALYLYMFLENKRRDRVAAEGQESEGDGVENGMLVRISLAQMFDSHRLVTDDLSRIKPRLITKPFVMFCKH